MTPLYSRRKKSGQWLRRKRNMMLFGALAFGPIAWLASWRLWEFDWSARWIFFLLILWMLGGLVWGWAMWRFFDFRSQSQKIDEAHPDNQQDT